MPNNSFSRTLRRLLPILTLLALSACGGDDNDIPAESGGTSKQPPVATPAPAAMPKAEGLLASSSQYSAAETLQRLDTALQRNEAIGIVARLDYSATARDAGVQLPALHGVFFGNPALGTPLMQANRTVAIDLPQKLVVQQASDSTSWISWNSAAYLRERHDLTGVDDALGKIDTALAKLATVAGGVGQPEIPAGPETAELGGNGLVVFPSEFDFDDTVSHLRAAIADHDELDLAFELDHQANAAKVNLELPPTLLLVLHNHGGDSALLRENAASALDLPQKILVMQGDDGSTQVIYNDPAYIANRYALTDQQQQIAANDALLSELARRSTLRSNLAPFQPPADANTRSPY